MVTMERGSYPNSDELLKLGDEELSAASILIKGDGPVRHIRRHVHGAVELFLKAYVVSKDANLITATNSPLYKHDLIPLYEKCCHFDATFQNLSSDVNLLARDYPANIGRAGCETSVEAHYNPQDDLDKSDTDAWFDSAIRIGDFVKTHIC